MRTLLTIIICLGCFESAFSCCAPDERTLTERLFTKNPGTIFTCRILSSTDPYPNSLSSTNHADGITTAQIIKLYFGKLDSNIITFNQGRVRIGMTYLIYSEETSGNNFQFGGICDYYSKEVIDNPEVNSELQLLQQFSDIVKNTTSGKFTFINSTHFILAKGEFNKGQPVNIWKHYYPETNIVKTEIDFKKNITTQYSPEGVLEFRSTINKNIYTYEKYLSKINNQLEFKEIQIKNDTGFISQWFEYFENGKIKSIQSGIKINSYTNNKGEGRTGIYEEYYENGHLKLKGQYLTDNPIGIWKWYKENGELEKELDYKEGIKK